MKLIHNTGADRVIDLMRPHLKHGNQLGCVTPSFSLFAFAELRDALTALERVQLVLPPGDAELGFLGVEGDRAARNRLQVRWLANQCAKWIGDKVVKALAAGKYYKANEDWWRPMKAETEAKYAATQKVVQAPVEGDADADGESH